MPHNEASNFGDLSCHWNSGQTVADRAKVCIERYWEVVAGLSIDANCGRLASQAAELELNFGALI